MIGQSRVSPSDFGLAVEIIGVVAAPVTGGQSLWLTAGGGLMSAAGKLEEGKDCQAAFELGAVLLGGSFTYSLGQVLPKTGQALDIYTAILAEVDGSKVRC